MNFLILKVYFGCFIVLVLKSNLTEFEIFPKSVNFTKKSDQKTRILEFLNWLATVLKIKKIHFFLFLRPKNNLNNEFLTFLGRYQNFLTLWKSLVSGMEQGKKNDRTVNHTHSHFDNNANFWGYASHLKQKRD